MIGSGPIGAYSRGQIGWRDSDGDGILDPLDTYPETSEIKVMPENEFLACAGADELYCRGKAVDKPLFNSIENKYGVYGNVTLNTITEVEYRINGSAWLRAVPEDGYFNSAQESFSFTTPALKNGKYLIEVKAKNSVGNEEISYARKVVEVTASSVQNFAPFASFTVSPEAGSINQTEYVFDASLSTDFEDESKDLQVRWAEANGSWATGYLSNKILKMRFASPGNHTVSLEVKDSGGLVSSISKTIYVLPFDLSPVASFKVTPSNQQGPVTDFVVEFDPSKSWDGETNFEGLLGRWDFENNGVWTPYAPLAQISYSYPQAQKLHFSKVSVAGDVWDVEANGNYLFAAAGESGLKIYDAANPDSMQLLTEFNPGGFAYRVHVNTAGTYAYISNHDHHIQIVNVANKSAPVLTGSFLLPSAPAESRDQNGFLHVADACSGLKIINVSNPQNPQLVGEYVPADGCVMDIELKNNYAFIASGNRGMEVIDISNPSAPQKVGSYETNRFANDVVLDGNYTYLSEGSMEVVGDGIFIASAFSKINILNISNLAQPVLTGSYLSDSIVLGMSLCSSYLCLAEYGGFDIVNTSDKTAPKKYAANLRSVASTNHSIDFRSPGYIFVSSPQAITVMNLSMPFAAAEGTTLWQPKLEVKDSSGQTAQAVREVWSVNYNHSPVLGDIGYRVFDELSFNRVSLTNFQNSFVAGFDISGNYAYVIFKNNLKVLDISSPESPVMLAGSLGLTGNANKIRIEGNHAFIASGSAGVHIININNPAQPVLIQTIKVSNRANYASDIAVQGSNLFVADSEIGLVIWDMTNISSPSMIGSFSLGSFGRIVMTGNFAYLSQYDGKFRVVNISNVSNPVVLKTVNSSADEIKAMSINADTLYVGHSFSGFSVYDITDKANPLLMTELDTDCIYDLFVDGTNLYIADLTNLKVADIQNGMNTFFTGKYDVSAGTSVTGVVVKDNLVYLARANAGLEIIQKNSQTTRKYSFSVPVATDVDGNTPPSLWNGVLKYRWDYDNDGTWDTRLDPDGERIEFLADYFLTGMKCQVEDGFGAFDNKIVFLNQQPVLNLPFTSKTIQAGETVQFNILATDADNDLMMLMHPLGSELPQGAQFSVSRNDPGVIEGAFQWTAQANQPGTHSILFNVSDRSDSNVSEVVNITVVSNVRKITGKVERQNSGHTGVGEIQIYGGPELGSITTNEAGYFEFLNVPVGKTYTVAAAQGPQTFTPQSCPVPATGDFNCVFKLNRHNISGYVFNADAPQEALAGIPVILDAGTGRMGEQSVTDSNGFYHFENIDDGTSFVLKSEKTRYEFIYETDLDITNEVRNVMAGDDARYNFLARIKLECEVSTNISDVWNEYNFEDSLASDPTPSYSLRNCPSDDCMLVLNRCEYPCDGTVANIDGSGRAQKLHNRVC
jgi:hypothetical protein